MYAEKMSVAYSYKFLISSCKSCITPSLSFLSYTVAGKESVFLRLIVYVEII